MSHLFIALAEAYVFIDHFIDYRPFYLVLISSYLGRMKSIETANGWPLAVSRKTHERQGAIYNGSVSFTFQGTEINN